MNRMYGPSRASRVYLLLASLLLPLPSAGQEAPKGTLEPIPDAGRPAPAELGYAHPLYRPYEQPPKLLQTAQAENFEMRAQLTLAVRVDETGKVTEILPVEPPLRGLGAAASVLSPRWTFEPAKKDGLPVRTWGSVVLDLDIAMERASFTSFTFRAVEKNDPTLRIVREVEGDLWILRYPREIQPKDGNAISVEDVDFLPQPKKTPWKFDATRLRSRFYALVQVTPEGTVARVVPVGDSVESAIVKWVRVLAAKWKVSPAVSAGTPVESWMYLETAIEFDLTRAKERGIRTLQKNLKAIPEG